MAISRLLHIVWIGDESRRPEQCIGSWRRLNSDFEVRVWGNADLLSRTWINGRHIRALAAAGRFAGVADLMRYEILFSEGGMAVDADAECVRPLPDWLLDPSEFASWENEHLRPGLITNAFMGAVPDSPYIGQLIATVHDKVTVTDAHPWKTTGPAVVTDVWKRYQYPLTIYPSHYFTPVHFSGQPYAGTGQVFARQFWSSTRADVESRGLAVADGVGVAS